MNTKPKYLILYKNKNWKLEFFRKRLFRYADELLRNNEDTYMFENFEVFFMKYPVNEDYLRGFKLFGIIIEENEQISKEFINKTLLPLIDNPFIGGIHVMK